MSAVIGFRLFTSRLVEKSPPPGFRVFEVARMDALTWILVLHVCILLPGYAKYSEPDNCKLPTSNHRLNPKLEVVNEK